MGKQSRRKNRNRLRGKDKNHHPLEGRRQGSKKKKNGVVDPEFGVLLAYHPWLSDSQLKVYMRDAEESPAVFADVVGRFQEVRTQIVELCAVIDRSFSYAQRHEAGEMLQVKPTTPETVLTPEQRAQALDKVIQMIVSNGGYPEGLSVFGKLAYVEKRLEQMKASGEIRFVGKHHSEVWNCFEMGQKVTLLIKEAIVIQKKIERDKKAILGLQLKINSSPQPWRKRK